jgi:hypothetical protein
MFKRDDWNVDWESSGEKTVWEGRGCSRAARMHWKTWL